ncbi:hypothetical protein ACVWZA_004393 [Sphingomonas sp. UYAg733]
MQRHGSWPGDPTRPCSQPVTKVGAATIAWIHSNPAFNCRYAKLSLPAIWHRTKLLADPGTAVSKTGRPQDEPDIVAIGPCVTVPSTAAHMKEMR